MSASASARTVRCGWRARTAQLIAQGFVPRQTALARERGDGDGVVRRPLSRDVDDGPFDRRPWWPLPLFGGVRDLHRPMHVHSVVVGDPPRPRNGDVHEWGHRADQPELDRGAGVGQHRPRSTGQHGRRMRAGAVTTPGLSEEDTGVQARPSPRRHPIVHLTSRQTTQERLTSSQDTVLEVRERLHLTAVESRHALQPGQAGHAEAALVHRPEPLSTAREDPPHSAVADPPGKAVSCSPGGSGRRCRRSRGTGR